MTRSSLTRVAAGTAVAGGVGSFGLLLALHVLKPDLDPSWRMLSEYAIGAHGWVMRACFLALALGYAGLFVALALRLRTVGGRLGLVFLLIAVVGLSMASAWVTDPLFAPPTPSGEMHGLSAAIGNPGLLLGALVLGATLWKEPLWAPVRLPLVAVAGLAWISLAVMVAAVIAASRTQSMEGPGVLGWANRVLWLGYCGWVVLAAWPLARRAPGAERGMG